MSFRSRLVYLIPLGLIAVGLVLWVRDSTAPARPVGAIEDIASLGQRPNLNVLFILVDTLRSDRLSCYGYERPTSPTIDTLCESGVRFSKHLAQSSWTKASMASLWTGVHPIRTGILRYNHALPSEVVMPAEVLRSRGMETAGIWRNGWVASNFGFAQGFDLYHKPTFGRIKAAHRRAPATSHIAGSDQDVTDSALEFIRLNGHRPWFLYVHYMDVHQYLSDEASALFGTTYSDIYDNSIHWVDRHIQILLDALDEARVRDETLIILASDHGEAFGEHDREGHAKDLYGEVTETPLILSLPFRIEPGLVVDTPSQNVDVWPTVLDLLGESPLPETDGRSLLPDILQAARRAPERRDGEISFAHLDRTWGRAEEKPLWLVAATEYPYRLIYDVDGKAPNELYRLDRDPSEHDNIYELESAISERLKQRADDYLALPRASWATHPKTVQLDDMLIGQLRAIGYAIE